MKDKPAVQINTMEDKELTPTEELKNEIRNILKSYFPISDFEVGAVNELSKLYAKRIGKAFYVGQNSSDQRVKELSEENKRLNELCLLADKTVKKYCDYGNERDEENKKLKEEIDNLKKERGERENEMLEMGKEITSHAFEAYSSLRKLVVELPDIYAAFDRKGIDIVENLDF